MGFGLHELGRHFPPQPIPLEREIADGGSFEFDVDPTTKERKSRPRPREVDVPAWIDWVRFWPHAINDELRQFVKRADEMGVEVPVTTNCITGHFINNGGDIGPYTGLFPWITSDGLGVLAIDTYTVGYLQGYMRALAGAGEGREFELHEAGGSDTPEDTAYMSLFSRIFGARGLLFWRRDHHLPNACALEVSRTMSALQRIANPDALRPRSDGVAVLYSFDSISVDDARTGSSHQYFDQFQAALAILKRTQSQYDVIADTQLAGGIPESIRALVAVGVDAVSDEDLKVLAAFVDGGGRMLVTADFAASDEYGRERSAADREAVMGLPGVTMVESTALRAWRSDLKGSERDPRFGFDAASPPEISTWKELLKAAPRSVTYFDAGGEILLTNAGVMEGNRKAVRGG